MDLAVDSYGTSRSFRELGSGLELNILLYIYGLVGDGYNILVEELKQLSASIRVFSRC